MSDNDKTFTLYVSFGRRPNLLLKLYRDAQGLSPAGDGAASAPVRLILTDGVDLWFWSVGRGWEDDLTNKQVAAKLRDGSFVRIVEFKSLPEAMVGSEAFARVLQANRDDEARASLISTPEDLLEALSEVASSERGDSVG